MECMESVDIKKVIDLSLRCKEEIKDEFYLEDNYSQLGINVISEDFSKIQQEFREAEAWSFLEKCCRKSIILKYFLTKNIKLLFLFFMWCFF